MATQEQWDRAAGFAEEEPTVEQLEEWAMDGIAEAMDGCRVEPDGHCEHGSPSWLLAMGLI